jgi:5'-nucleotidase
VKLLLTNDDGFDAPGLEALAAVLQDFGDVVVVAPHIHVSGCSHLTTTHRGLELSAHRASWHKLDGSPADCTRVGLLHVVPDADWVISGINAGGNLGADVYLSGTVAAAREACFLGKPAIAISQYFRRSPIAWDVSATWAREALRFLLEQAPPERSCFWNVNLPDPEQFRSPKRSFCPLDTNALPVQFVERDGKLHYHGKYQDRLRTPGSDVDICFGGGIAMTKLCLGSQPGAIGATGASS